MNTLEVYDSRAQLVPRNLPTGIQCSSLTTTVTDCDRNVSATEGNKSATGIDGFVIVTETTSKLNSGTKIRKRGKLMADVPARPKAKRQRQRGA